MTYGRFMVSRGKSRRASLNDNDGDCGDWRAFIAD